MRVLITGASGFIGTNLLEYFIAHQHQVCNFDIAPPRNIVHQQHWCKGDLLNVHDLRATVMGFSPDVIFHLAARTDLDGGSINDYLANTNGVQNLINAARDTPSLKRILFASSRLVCKIGYTPHNEYDYCPTTAYGQSKVIGEQIIRDGMSSVACSYLIVRPTSIWGPWFGAPYKNFFLSIAGGSYIHPSTASIHKSFGFVGNTIYELIALMAASNKVIHGKTFYLADYTPIDVLNFANSIQDTLGVRPIKKVSIVFLRAIAWAGTFLQLLGWRHPPLTIFRLNNLITPMVYDLRSLEEIVGPLPYSTKDGIQITTVWLKAQGDIT
jgi:nucleoside-diphosphate-sugar epimerase